MKYFIKQIFLLFIYQSFFLFLEKLYELTRKIFSRKVWITTFCSEPKNAVLFG